MADIESRIAELLKEALGKGYKQVVTMEDIDQIIRLMGSPDAVSYTPLVKRLTLTSNIAPVIM